MSDIEPFSANSTTLVSGLADKLNETIEVVNDLDSNTSISINNLQEELNGISDFSDVEITGGIITNTNITAFGTNESGNGSPLTITNNSNSTTFGLDSSGTLLINNNNNSLRIGNNNVFHEGNDGSGSGLDADLLDGQQGSYYTNITARLGYTPLNSAGGTISGNLNTRTLRITSTSNGSLSSTGHGFQIGSSSNANLIMDTNELQARSNRTSATLFLNPLGGDVRVNGQTVWHRGNDGSGSGLDADLLDGQQGSYYTNITARLGYTPLDSAGDRIIAFGTSTTNPDNVPLTITDENNNISFLGLTNNGTFVINNTTTNADIQFDTTGSGSIKFGNNNIYHEGNIGPAITNLDAGSLNGQEGSYYEDITARLGYTPLDSNGGTIGGGINFDNVVGNSPNDLTNHISLFGTVYGFNVTSNRLNYTSANFHDFYQGADIVLSFNRFNFEYMGNDVVHEGNFYDFSSVYNDRIVFTDTTTLSLSHIGTIIEVFSTTVTIPNDSDVNFPIRTKLDFTNLGTGAASIAPATGVTLRSADNNRNFRVRYSSATAYKRGANDWVLIGDLV